MRIDTLCEGELDSLSIEGVLECAATTDSRARLPQWADECHGSVSIDLRGLAGIDSSGVALLVCVLNRLCRRRVTLVRVSWTPERVPVLEMFRFAEIEEFYFAHQRGWGGERKVA